VLQVVKPVKRSLMKKHPLLRELMGDLDTPGSQAGRFFFGSDVEILTKLNEQMDMWIGKNKSQQQWEI
jgi:hypothetical protein